MFASPWKRWKESRWGPESRRNWDAKVPLGARQDQLAEVRACLGRPSPARDFLRGAGVTADAAAVGDWSCGFRKFRSIPSASLRAPTWPGYSALVQPPSTDHTQAWAFWQRKTRGLLVENVTACGFFLCSMHNV